MGPNRVNKFRRMTIDAFLMHFASEEDCVHALFELRWPKGWVCPRCGHTHYYHIAGRRLFECASCRYQSSVTAGTVLHKTRTPLRVWLLALFLVISDKRGISSLALSEHLGVSARNSWSWLHKIRHAMGQGDANERLCGYVELAECFVGDPREGGPRRKRKDPPVKALFLMSQLEPGGGPVRILMAKIRDVSRDTLKGIIERRVVEGSHVSTGALRSYRFLDDSGYVHDQRPDAPSPQGTPWIRVIGGNFRANIAGTYHGVSNKHLQAYFDEFCYRFNRRKRPDLALNCLVVSMLSCKPWTYRDIIGSQKQTRGKENQEAA